MLDEMGLFDEGYWMYMEDLDLCYRVAQAGWVTWYEPAVKAIHVKAGTSGRTGGLRSTMRSTTHVPLLPHAPRAEPKPALQCGRVLRHRHQVSHRCSRVGNRAAAESSASSSRRTIRRFGVVAGVVPERPVHHELVPDAEYT